MDQQCLIVHIYLIFFIHSVIDGHWSCFHILVMANKDSENIGVHRFSQISIFIFLGYSEVEFLGHMAVLFLVFGETFILFCKVMHQFTFPPTEHKASLFSTSSPELITCCGFDDSLTDRRAVTSHCGFDLHFPGE